MSSEVEICNLALAHLGDSASVASLDPPEGSAQAEHCARFYPIARNALLEMHEWNFATRRIALSLLTATNDQWAYVYAVPNLMIKALAVIPPEVDNDYSSSGVYIPQPYALETLDTGEVVVCTNQEDAVLRYIVLVSDPVKFSSLFTLCLSWLLASMLAGPVIKGDVGMAEGKRCYQMMQAHLSAATVSDANQQKIDTSDATRHFVPWLTGR